MFFLFFFFSSRRRHTRWNCDWSSDVCSSDLTHSGSFEWDHFLKSNANNRLLLTFTNQADQRKWIGQPFPSVTIVDGTNATLSFGSEANTGVNDFQATDLGLLDVFTYVRGKHVYTTGTD